VVSIESIAQQKNGSETAKKRARARKMLRMVNYTAVNKKNAPERAK
jgi:hypothetical protein